jgi:ferritin-like metal-binding protein YciE
MPTFHEMFEDGIKDAYNAEKQLIKALPKMAKMAQNQGLRDGFENHLRQTEGHARRIEQAASQLGFKPSGMVCKAMKGLVEEADEHMKGLKPSACTDAELIALAQKVEHYEIATYGTLCEWARMMGHEEAFGLLKQNLTEEEQTDELLTRLAEGQVNQMAAEESNQMMMEDSHSKGSNGSSSGRSKTSSARKTTTSRSSSGRSKAGSSR